MCHRVNKACGTDGQTKWKQYTPNNFDAVWGYNNPHWPHYMEKNGTINPTILHMQWQLYYGIWKIVSWADD